MDSSGHAVNVSAWTVNVSHHGARVRGVKDWSEPGETVGIRCGLEKARFRIVWVGADGTPHEGEIGLLCIDAGKYIWGVEAPEDATAAAPGSGHPAGIIQFPNLQRVPIGLSSSAPSVNDRRKDVRYKATGGAKVQEIGASAGQWATLHDLSLGGCYVETTAPLPRSSRVEISIHINNVQINARGLVAVCHKVVGMGVQFSEISPSNRTRLETVMEMLMQTSTEA